MGTPLTEAQKKHLSKVKKDYWKAKRQEDMLNVDIDL
jgi:hypothetical protein